MCPCRDFQTRGFYWVRESHCVSAACHTSPSTYSWFYPLFSSAAEVLDFLVLNNRFVMLTAAGYHSRIFLVEQHEFLENLMSGWSVCWSVWVEGRSAVGGAHNWFLGWGSACFSSGLQFLVVCLCCWWVERDALCLCCTSLSHRATLCLHISHEAFSGCLAVFQLDWLSLLFTRLPSAIC